MPNVSGPTYAIQLLKIRVIHAVDIKPRLWNLGPRTPALGEEFPQLLRVVDIPRKPAAHANNGNRGLHRHQPFSQRALLDIRLSNKVSEFRAREVRVRASTTGGYLGIPGVVGSKDSSRSESRKKRSE